jgi:HTH-type transcriptional regulator/antitoxin HigA
MDIAPIKTQRDYRSALKEIERLMTAKRNTPEGDRLDNGARRRSGPNQSHD